MSTINLIQSAIMQLEGGSFQKLFDEYLYKKYKFKNIQTLGVQTGTNKPTKGTPDSYVLTADDKYILINYGTVSSTSVEKIRADILSCFDEAKLRLSKDKIEKIICGHCSTNIHIEQFDDIRETIEGVNIELIGIDTLSHDLALFYPHIAKDVLGISIDSYQFFELEDFVKAYDANGINAPISCDFLHRESEISEVCKSIEDNRVTILTGPSGIGKTRLAIEVCRKLIDEKTQVFCVKSNGNLLYEDIKYYISEPGEYLIFLDDANMVASLDNVLGTLLTLSAAYSVKLLISVRDYAKERVIKTVSRFELPFIFELGQFKDDEIKDILKADLAILNSDYLKRITDIANGNIRLAFLAGMRSVEDGFQAIRNAEDIFRNYYGRIIDDARLAKEDILMLFFIAVAGPVKSNENQFYIDLKNKYGTGISEDDTIEHLYSLELVDWFKNEITKIVDQSLGNYILYYVLFEKKWITVENLISIGFPRFKNKVIYALNTLIAIFHSEECAQYIEESIISAWNNAPDEQEMEYTESFYQVYPDKALSIIKNHIEQAKQFEFDLRSFDIEPKKNYHNISNKDIEILGGYKNTGNYEDAIELLRRYYEKRPDLIMDFFFVICDRLLYDRNSYKNKYKHERIILDKLWLFTEEGENYNNSFLYLQIVACALKTEISFTEEIRNSRSVNFVQMTIGYNKEIADIRNCIWQNLSVLRKKEEFRELVNKILSEVHFNGLDKEDSKNYLQSDFDVIYEQIINQDMPDFFDAKIVARYKEVADQLEIKTDQRYLISEKNPVFVIYRMLTREHITGRTIEEDKQLRKASISARIKKYALCDYQDLFNACSFLEKNMDGRDQWSLNTGLDCVFEIIEDDIELYVSVIKEYFKADAPLQLNGYRQTKYLLDHIGYNETYRLIQEYSFEKKDIWLSFIWECIPEEQINEEVVKDYKEFSLINLNKDNPIVPSIQTAIKYGKRDCDLKTKVISAISVNQNASARFLGYAYHDDEIEDILMFFEEDIDALINIYMESLSVSCHVDYDGKLFMKIYERNNALWNLYIDWIKSKDNMRQDGNERYVFEAIWNTDAWRECIDYAFKTLIEEDDLFYLKEPAGLVFQNTADTTVVERQKAWLFDKLHENIMDITRCQKLIAAVVNFKPEMKMEYILELLKANRNLENFKEIDLFPLSSFWSGSEIPLIIEKIDFLNSLKDNLRGIDYIDYRQYLEERRLSLEKYKEKVELREYLENADYT